MMGVRFSIKITFEGKDKMDTLKVEKRDIRKEADNAEGGNEDVNA